MVATGHRSPSSTLHGLPTTTPRCQGNWVWETLTFTIELSCNVKQSVCPSHLLQGVMCNSRRGPDDSAMRLDRGRRRCRRSWRGRFFLYAAFLYLFFQCLFLCFGLWVTILFRTRRCCTFTFWGFFSLARPGLATGFHKQSMLWHVFVQVYFGMRLSCGGPACKYPLFITECNLESPQCQSHLSTGRKPINLIISTTRF